MTIKKVNKWETSDGHTHSTELDAQHHEQYVQMVRRLYNVLDTFYFNGMSTSDIAVALADTRVKEEMRTAYGF